MMKNLAILLPDGTTTLSSLILTVELIETANEYFEKKGKDPVLNTTLVGSEKRKRINHSFSIHQDKTTTDVYNADLIIVPSLGDDLDSSLKRNKENIAWVNKQYKRGAEVASLCTGAFILAAAGILKGKSCSTHWGSAETFRRMFPEVNLMIDKIITDEKGVYTSGGAIS